MEKILKLAELGMSNPLMAKALDVSQSTIDQDVRLMRRDGHLRAQKERLSYPKLLYVYACHARPDSGHDYPWDWSSEDSRAARRVIADWLGVEATLAVIRQTVTVMRHLCTPGALPEQRGYWRLLRAIFGSAQPDIIAGDHPERRIWYDYLEAVAQNRTPAPASLSDVMAATTQTIVAECRPSIAPLWTLAIGPAVDEVLATLNDRERQVITERFGLKEAPKTLAEAGVVIGASSERVRQIESLALRKLRHPVPSRRLGRFWYPIGDSLAKQLKEEARERAAAEREEARRRGLPDLTQRIFGTQEIDVDPMVLLKSVEELEVSVRSANCLRAAEIGTIGELVSRREAVMLSYHNFGRKSLGELREVLAEMGLRFGLALPEDWYDVLRQADR